MNYQWDWGIVFTSDTFNPLLTGLEFTLGVSLICLVLGNILGLAAAMGRLYAWKPVGILVYIYVDFFRTTPALVQLIWIFYVLPIVTGIDFGPVQAGIIALSLNAGAFLAEIYRGGLQSIGAAQREASHVLGLSRIQTLRYVVFPQAFRRVLPAITNVLISLLKDTSLLSVIAVSEITYQITNRVAATYRPLELYTALAVVYFVITYPISLGAGVLERRLRLPGM